MIPLDRRPEAAVWGVPDNHVVGDITEIDNPLFETKFDVIILMGVIGYGVNTLSQVAAMLESASNLILPGGTVLIACESRFGLDPLKISETEGSKLRGSPSFCFPVSVSLPDFDYGFYFLSAMVE